jgi:hypothetical protein
MRKLAIASAMLGVALALSSMAPVVYAADKVDCDAVMQELGQGKKAKEVASDLKISTSSVYRCKRHAKAAAKAEMKSSQGMSEKMGNAASMGAAPSPATSK